MPDKFEVRFTVHELSPGQQGDDCHSKRLSAYRVSTRVNRPANDDPSLIEEVEG